MAQAHFSEQLHTRREQLRLTIPQAAKVLRMRESVLVAFENGDFEHLPPLGYAQGMISSYARYLGLNPTQIAADYEAEHAAYIASVTGSAPVGLASLSDEPGHHNPTSAVMSQRRRRSDGQDAYADGYLGGAYSAQGRVSEPVGRPGMGTAGTAAGAAAASAPAGAYANGPAGAAPGRSLGSQNNAYGYPGSAGAGVGAGMGAGLSAGASLQDRTSAMRPTNLHPRYNSQSYGQGVMASEEQTVARSGRYSDQLRYGSDERRERRYTTAAPEQVSDERRRGQANRVRRSRMADDYPQDYAEQGRGYETSQERYARTGSPYASSYHQDTIQTRAISGSYQDDLRYGSDATAYRASSTREGRAGMHNMPAPERPNVRRRSNNADPRNRNTQPQATGFAGYVEAFLADPQRAILSIGVILALVLLIILVLSVKSCVAANATDSREVNVVTSLAASTTAEASTISDAEQQVLSDAAAKAAASADAAQYTETVVKVSVADGATSWVEITCDGEQKVAESITGAWEQSFTVTQSITIQVVDPSSVTVEKNGAIQSFSSKSAGLSSITIEGTDPAAAAAATAATTDAESEDDSDYSDDTEE